MTIRNLNYEEAYNLFHKLTKNGYPAQLYQCDDKWRVMIEGITTNGSGKVDNLFG